MDTAALERFGIELYGRSWSSRLAAALDLSDSHFRNLRAGRRPWTDATRRRLRRILDEAPDRLEREHVARLDTVIAAKVALNEALGSG